ncbi:MAG: hypothetical protein RR322_04700 [Oscillospiraceae bacterium]
MTIIKLIENEEYTYKQLCELKNEPYLHANSKISQLQQWSKYEVFEKNGTKYKYIRARTADEIQIYELDINYSELLEIFIFSYLATITENKLTTTIPKLAEMMCIRNQNYSYGKYNQAEVLHLIADEKLEPLNNEDITSENLKAFFEKTEPNYQRKIKEAIHKMEKMGLIAYNKFLYLGVKNKGYTTMRKATDAENILLLDVEGKILNTFPMREVKDIDGTRKIVKADKTNLTNLENFIFYNKRTENFIKALNSSNKITNEIYLFFYNEYEIFLNSKSIGSHIPYKIQNLKIAMNKKVMKSLVYTNRSFIDWFIDTDTTANIKQLIIDNQKKLN